MPVITILKLSWGTNDFYAFLRYFFDSVIRDYALNFRKMAVYVEVSFTRTYSIAIFILTYMAYNFMLVITVLKLSWGPNDFYASLSNYFDSVIRDYALNFHAKWLSMLRSHSLVTYSIGIFILTYVA
jgi:hypothetical protein